MKNRTKLQENKEIIDKKQDEVIKQLKENQVELIKSVDVLSDIMSKQGSESGVKRWVDDLPSDFDPLDAIGEEDEAEPKEEPKSLFNAVDTEIIKKYGFDPTLKNIPTNKEIRSKISSTTGKMNSKNTIIKNLAKKESEVLKRYLAATTYAGSNIEKSGESEKSGEGIRRLTINQNETPIRYHNMDSMVVWSLIFQNYKGSSKS